MLDCKSYSEMMKQKIRETVSGLEGRPKLAIIQVGDDPASNSYVKGKKCDCDEVGFEFEHYVFDSDVTTDKLLGKIGALNVDHSISGIIVELPLPKHININAIMNSIYPFKNVDGFGELSKFEPCTPKGVIDYLEYNDYVFEGKNACVVGRSKTIGMPLAKMLLDRDCTVTVCHSKTDVCDLQTYMSESDIVFTCTNKIEQFDEAYLSVLSDLVDFGIGVGKDGKLHGNVHRDTVKMLKEANSDVENHIAISGTGGTGLLTRIALLANTLKAYHLNKNMTSPEWL